MESFWLEEQFKGISEKTSFPIDQVRYLFLFLCSFPLACFYRVVLTPSKVPLSVRHLFCVVLGLSFTLICFKLWEVFVLLGFVIVCYVILISTSPATTQRYTMVFAFSSILLAHIHRMLTDYEGWHQDFTGPLMVLVQRVTSVSCSVYDGLGKSQDQLTEYQMKHKLQRKPTTLEYFSYNFNFLSVLAGPMYSINDYLEFVSGDNLKPLPNPNKFAKAKEHGHAPSPLMPVLMKVFSAVFFMSLTFFLTEFTPDAALDPAHSLPSRIVYVFLAAFKVRCLYYFVFILTDAICNMAGLGFRGYDETGKAQWDLVTNVKPLDLEFGRNPREQVQAWNIGTTIWLKRCVYDRIGFYPNFSTWILSAFWHGLYPGYHLSFIVFAFATLTARKVRRKFWKRFQSPSWVKTSYDMFTWLSTSVGRDFGALPFILLSFEKTIILWSSYYYIPLILCASLYLLIPNIAPAAKPAATNGYNNKED